MGFMLSGLHAPKTAGLRHIIGLVRTGNRLVDLCHEETGRADHRKRAGTSPGQNGPAQSVAIWQEFQGWEDTVGNPGPKPDYSEASTPSILSLPR